MSLTSAPYGLQPVSNLVGNADPITIKNGIASGLSSNIFRGQAVMLDTTNGTITPVTATTDKIYGVFAGVQYTPTGQRPTYSPFWPASSTYVAGYEDMNVMIWPAWIPGTKWRIQADGTVPQTDYGAGFNLVNFGNGSTVTGLSACQANHTSIAGGSQGQLQLIEFGENINNAVGDTYTDLIVAIAYPQAVFTGILSPG